MHTVIARASMACAHGSVTHGDRREHAVEVRERLAHALEHDAVHALAAVARERAAHVAHLLDDLPRLEVAREAHAPRRAERARERAADLRADAHREAAPCRSRAGCARSRRVVRRRPRARACETGRAAPLLGHAGERRHVRDATQGLERSRAGRRGWAARSSRRGARPRRPAAPRPRRASGTAAWSERGV